jgi:hypothetical protein
MTTQPEALRLADQLGVRYSGFPTCDEAAAELRRLHALCGEWEKKAATWLASPQAAQRLDGYRELAQRLNAAEAVNQELLEALKAAYRHAVNHDESLPFDWAIHCEMLHSAIAKAEGQA